MDPNATILPASQERRDAVICRKAPPSAVLSFAAPIGAGKTKVSTQVALRLVAPRVSFGEYLRGHARAHGLEMTREVLQDLGDKFVRHDARRFCEDVLKQQAWEPGKPLIIDGVRHVEVLDSLAELLAPAKSYLIYIKIDRTTQTERLKGDPLPHKKSLDELEKHPTEQQVRSTLPDRAALFLDGTQDPEELTRKVIEFLVSKGGDTGQDQGWDEKNN